MSKLMVGMLVQSKHRDMPLRSGAEWYPAAVVVQLDPFVLISEGGDMVWSKTVEAENFEPCGVASTEAKVAINKRLDSQGMRDIQYLPVTELERATLWLESNGQKEIDLGADVSYGSYTRETTRVTINEMYQAFEVLINSKPGLF